MVGKEVWVGVWVGTWGPWTGTCAGGRAAAWAMEHKGGLEGWDLVEGMRVGAWAWVGTRMSLMKGLGSVPGWGQTLGGGLGAAARGAQGLVGTDLVMGSESAGVSLVG